jgi:S1-C subfamily serine protease
MKKLFIFITSIIMFGFNHVEKVQDSFGFIRAHYFIKQKEICIDCNHTLDFNEDTINKDFMSMTFIKASSFVIKRFKNKTHVLTSNHVCKAIREFYTFSGTKTNNYISNRIKDAVLESKEVRERYEIKPTVSITTFDGLVYKDLEILSESKKHDICLINVPSSFGTPVVMAKDNCTYTDGFNISASGGFYLPKSTPLRTGFINNKADKVMVEGAEFENVNVYTIQVSPGASGSAVFNESGEVCGNINIAYEKLQISFGASSETITEFYKNYQKSL